jgi:hypothetical protein
MVLSSTDLYVLRVLQRSNPDALTDELKRRGYTKLGERMKVMKACELRKPAALRGLDIAFGLTFTTPPGGRSPPFTRGRGAPLL